MYNFSQDDLLTEDMLILDTHAEVFVWVGQCVDAKEKQSAFEIGEKYIEIAVSLEGLSPNVPLYKVTEGNEPCFFTTYFSWDNTKAAIQGNSFQKKVSILFGFGSAVEDKSNGNQGGGPTQRASALAALSSAFKPSSGKSPTSQERSNGSGQGPRQRAEALAALSSAFNSSSGAKSSAPRPSSSGQGSQRAAAVAALSQVLTAETKTKSTDGSPTRSPPSESSHPEEEKSESANSETGSVDVAEVKEVEEVAPASENNVLEPKQETTEDENDSESSLSTFSYDQLKAKSDNPVTGIDFKRREAYLSEEEFQTIFGITKEAFYKLPKWKQDMQKKKFDLF